MLIDILQNVGTTGQRRREIDTFVGQSNGFNPVVYKAVLNHWRARNDVGRLTEGFKIWKEPIEVAGRRAVPSRFPEVFRKKTGERGYLPPSLRRRRRKVARLSYPNSGVTVALFDRLIPFVQLVEITCGKREFGKRHVVHVQRLLKKHRGNTEVTRKEGRCREPGIRKRNKAVSGVRVEAKIEFATGVKARRRPRRRD